MTYIYTPATATALNSAFYYMNINAPSDPYAAVILAYAYVQSLGMFVIASDLQYGKPVVNPPILQNFTAVPGAIADTLSIVNLTDLTVEFNNSNPGGFRYALDSLTPFNHATEILTPTNRQTYWALMVKNSPTLMADITAIYMDEVSRIANVSGVVPSCVFQPITTDMTSYFSKNGGNALGVSSADGPLNLINIDISWSLISDDAAVMQAARNIVNRSNATAYAQGLGFPYLYENYAALEQDVFASYGEENLERLRAVSAKYDPRGVWQKLQPGYFKVGTS